MHLVPGVTGGIIDLDGADGLICGIVAARHVDPALQYRRGDVARWPGLAGSTRPGIVERVVHLDDTRDAVGRIATDGVDESATGGNGQPRPRSRHLGLVEPARRGGARRAARPST